MFYSQVAEYTYLQGVTSMIAEINYRLSYGQNTKLAVILYQRKEDQHQTAVQYGS